MKKSVISSVTVALLFAVGISFATTNDTKQEAQKNKFDLRSMSGQEMYATIVLSDLKVGMSTSLDKDGVPKEEADSIFNSIGEALQRVKALKDRSKDDERLMDLVIEILGSAPTHYGIGSTTKKDTDENILKRAVSNGVSAAINGQKDKKELMDGLINIATELNKELKTIDRTKLSEVEVTKLKVVTDGIDTALSNVKN